MGGTKKEKQALRRKDCFFGLHFDIHAQADDTSLGAELSEENVAMLLERVKPDFVQYDCKGHPGYAGYPTKVGTASPGIVKDALPVWRKVTREHGVALFIHYSGVLDGAAIEQHPDWAALDVDGNIYESGQVTSTFGPYVDELMIPQLKEVIGAYDLDGVWVDGENWGVELDYSPAALAAWKEATGHEDAPKDRSEPHWLEWKNFHRDRFEQYVCHWMDSVHESFPESQLCSNWMSSIAGPRPVKAKADYLSGDYSPHCSADTGRRQARYLASTGMPWDLMSWGFIMNGEGNRHWKVPDQVNQEAGAVLMQGGGFQIYHKTTRGGYVPEDIMGIAKEVGDFCRKRQAVSHKSTTVPQVALLFSTATLWDRCETPYDPEPAHLFDELKGMLHALLELHYSVDILSEHQLQDRLDEFPIVVIPHAHVLQDGFKEALLSYVKKGGSLMLSGHESAGLFEEALGVEFEELEAEAVATISASAGLSHADGEWQKVKPVDAEVISHRYTSFDKRVKGEPASTVMAYGEGQIGAIYGPVSLTYCKIHHPYLRSVIGDVISRLFTAPSVSVDAPVCVDIALRRTARGQLSLHMLNLCGAQRAPEFTAADFIPTLGPIAVKMNVPEKPDSVEWVPGSAEVDWSWEDGELTASVQSLHIHGVLVIN